MKWTLSFAEEQAYKTWDADHLADFHDGVEPDMGTVGGRISFTILRLSDRDVIGVECNHCRTAGRSPLDYSTCINDRSKR